MGRFIGVDPIADQFPQFSSFNYSENDPVGGIDLWGLQKVKVNGEPLKARGIFKKVFSHGDFAAQNPRRALKIGMHRDKGKNISSISFRFAENIKNLTGFGEPQDNAIRHGIWIGKIAKEFSSSEARVAGYSHEGVSHVSSSVELDEQEPFGTTDNIDLADSTVDFFNNEIAISIVEGLENPSYKEIVKAVLEEYVKNGFYEVVKTQDCYTIQKAKLTIEQFHNAYFNLDKLDENGHKKEN